MITTSILKLALKIAGKILSVIVFLLTILAAYGGKVNPEYFAYPSLLTLTLPYLGGATILLTIIWLCCKKIIFTALGVLTIVICMPTLSQAFPISFPGKPMPGETTFTLMTWNVLHTEDQQNPDLQENRTMQYIINSGVDIVCLQEMLALDGSEIKHYTPALGDSLHKAYPYTAGPPGESDVKVLSKYPVRILPAENVGSNNLKRRFHVFEVNIKGQILHIVNVHLISYSLTSSDREILTDIHNMQSAKTSASKFKATVMQKLTSAFRLRASNARDLRTEINDIPGALIVCGDFNDVPSSWAYRTIRGDDLKDAYAETNFGPTFTYNSHLFLFHIDQILYRGPLKALSVKREGNIKTSDHYPQIATFAFLRQHNP